MSLPDDREALPWRWSAWFNNVVRVGKELGDGFGDGLVRAIGATDGQLDVGCQLGGHRPTAVMAVGELMLGLRFIDLSQNSLTAAQVHPAIGRDQQRAPRRER